MEKRGLIIRNINDQFYLQLLNIFLISHKFLF